MQFDLSSQPEIVQQAYGYALQGWELAMSWLLSPAAWSQFALLVLAWFLAGMIARRLRPALAQLIDPKEKENIFSTPRRFVLPYLALISPLLAYALTGIGEGIVRSLFDSGAVIAFGKRLFLFLAARALVRDIIKDPFLNLLGRYILLPIMAIYALGLLDVASTALTETVVGVGNIRFSLMTLVRGLIAGSLLFWLGQWSNTQTTALITKNEEMRPSIRQLLIKTAEFSIFAIAFLLLMNIMGINLSALAVLGGAIGVGLGFGLQKIASNFISGVILLVEGQATVGDYVELDGGEQGKIVKMMARAAILETFDGRWIVVPNEDFITTRVVNYSDSGSANRYEAPFSVSYDTDINLVPPLIEAAVAKHPEVLDLPYPPDCELRGFGDNGIDFAVEFWVNGLDDGPNKYTSDVLFLIWNALKDAGIEIPYPQRVVEIKGGFPKVDA
ncbi:mechanosensitive ion channel family protein [Sulfitobacter geojensis]|uniref:Mechanosensitive ion channel n=1 Tax=Sulfitobacter geojensis TaxID=1342299 RepID=A0AAE2VYB2_9RHOB|nr:mechanosensitive ion channel domain-containing protein [Sulfitobacter geojensis]MBM1689730.1 mechanosensitive ion channel [Sulfitobacter geojensis]MBM1693796.1 mechanosensitive ion channel [Sulfitobacter geojensis]MBM1705962.1 mechanosensitive ion channel [Sulfitobacter geojensis]MBM1710020.1 mechanosensitive ion channel [Sulfitobacter geojensis]MBM1714086.1 mechanosensitive ion channel [Sulfitobacter geojensis]